MPETEGSSNPEGQKKFKLHRYAAERVSFLRESVTPPSAELATKYRQQKESIQNIYSQVADWHGTGRYQYRDGSNEPLDKLASIASFGLIPQEDPFDRLTGVVRSVSISHSRPYSMIYATMHLTESEDYAYRFHSSDYWLTRMMMDGMKKTIALAPGHFKGKSWSEIIQEIPKPPSSKPGNKVDQWLNKLTRKGKSPEGVFGTRSDIEGNYPILIGLKDDAFTPEQLAFYLKSHEKRSQQAIPPANFTHIEVPLQHVAETEQFLRERGSNLPVIPIEMGEIYSSEFSPKALIAGNPFRNTS